MKRKRRAVIACFSLKMMANHITVRLKTSTLAERKRIQLVRSGKMGTKMPKFEEAVYAFALRYASGRHTYAHGLVIDEIIRHLKDFPCPESFLREVELRRGDALRGFVPWDIDEEAEFINLEIQIKAEIERRKVEG